MTTIIISIKPQFCKAIYAGTKSIELRRRVGQGFNPGAKLYIYTSKTDKGIKGEALIQEVERLSVERIKQIHLTAASISEKEFDLYYKGRNEGFAIHLTAVTEYKEAIPLNKLRPFGFTPPQSFMYASAEIESYIESTKCI